MPIPAIGVVLELIPMLIIRYRGIVAESAAAAMVAAAKIQGAGLATIGLAGAGKYILSVMRGSVMTRC
jgi:F-type H+-transporting ATPase subunit c